jgi:ABC-type sugar transport system substrate-binding protein
VVSALQENPDTNYIVFTSGDFSLGVAAAVQAAGFDDVRLIGATPIQANVESMRSGGIDEAWAGVSNIVIGWRLVDGAVRYFNGDPIAAPVALTPDDTGPAAWPVTRLYTPETAPETADFVEPENYAEIFSELWHLT